MRRVTEKPLTVFRNYNTFLSSQSNLLAYYPTVVILASILDLVHLW